MLAADKFFVMKVQKMSLPDLVSWLLDTATLQEAHPYHGANWPDWIPGAGKFRQHAESLLAAAKAAEHKDKEKVKLRDQEMAAAVLSVHLNASYIVLRWHHEKDDGLLHNAGYVLKEQTKKSYSHLSIRTTPLDISVKKGPDDGSVVVKFEKDLAAGSYQLQICKGDPVGEQSWGDDGFYKSCRIIVRGLDRASWYYFRVRCHGDNRTNPWSKVVGIIVV